MKTVRLEENVVVEVIPEYALPVEKWYGVEFAAQCVEAPDYAKQGWVYDGESFIEPIEPEPTPAEPSTETDLMNLTIDHEYRLTLIELGVS